jgi:hypothetical protein
MLPPTQPGQSILDDVPSMEQVPGPAGTTVTRLTFWGGHQIEVYETIGGDYAVWLTCGEDRYPRPGGSTKASSPPRAHCWPRRQAGLTPKSARILRAGPPRWSNLTHTRCEVSGAPTERRLEKGLSARCIACSAALFLGSHHYVYTHSPRHSLAR